MVEHITQTTIPCTARNQFLNHEISTILFLQVGGSLDSLIIASTVAWCEALATMFLGTSLVWQFIQSLISLPVASKNQYSQDISSHYELQLPPPCKKQVYCTQAENEMLSSKYLHGIHSHCPKNLAHCTSALGNLMKYSTPLAQHFFAAPHHIYPRSLSDWIVTTITVYGRPDYYYCHQNVMRYVRYKEARTPLHFLIRTAE
jgi:hypothetical protein